LYKKVFRANLGKSGKNILRTPKKLPAPTPMIREFGALRVFLFAVQLVQMEYIFFDLLHTFFELMI